MELCHQLRLLFNKDHTRLISHHELHAIINQRLDKDYTLDQITIGMDYAGFKRVGDAYLVELNKEHEFDSNL